ncbi:pre-mRNA splicing factor [Lanmaoa asiatica]|nr:pre-mRNA splicing factor [Lanmaoa asiatica]
MSSDINRFVSDNCLKFFGLAERSIIDFVTASASSSKSPEALFTSLTASGLPNTSDAHAFVTELFQRVPRKSKHRQKAAVDEGARRQAEREARELTAKKYGFLLDEGDSKMDVVESADKPSRRAGKEKQERRLRKRELDSKEWESDEDEMARKRHKTDAFSSRSRSRTPPDDAQLDIPEIEDTEVRKERKRIEDLKSRDEFAERLADDVEARTQALPSLRVHSRQEYLTKREIQQIELLRREIADDEALFAGMRVSKREQRELERKKELLKLVEERLKINDKWEGYQLPEDYFTEQGKIDKKKKENVLYQRYEEAKRNDDHFVTDVDQWEASQTKHSTFKTSALDKREIADTYEYVFDESQTIKFVMDQTLKGEGMMSEKDKLLQRQIEEAEQRIKTIEETRKSLPIYTYREELLTAIKEHQVLIVVAETGSGKTTQLPQYLHEAGYTAGGLKIGCTQPRRVAAMSVAARVAEEMGTKVGYEVGYSIRFEDCTSDKTVLKYMTDGMLLREFLTEPDLAGYSALIIDEAHERTLSTDILFALVKDIARFRPELRLLISSATMDAEKFSEYFDGAPVFYVPGRRYPVDIHYTPQPEANYLHDSITNVFHIHDPPKAIILGQDESKLLKRHPGNGTATRKQIAELIVCPIYANLFLLTCKRNIELPPTTPWCSQSSLPLTCRTVSRFMECFLRSITGIPEANVDNPKRCSRASANQRAGRAGRVGPGKAFRLYTKWAFANELEENTIPEIQRTNLGMTVLMLKSLGINNFMEFEFMDPPPGETLIRALELLYALGALNDRGELTKLGRRMAEFPVDPMLSKAIIESEQYVCTDEVLTIISMLSESSSLFYRPKDKKLHADQARQNFVRAGGDHFTLLNCERVEVIVRSNPNSNDITPIQKAITSGYFYNTAQLQRSGDSYRTLKTNQTVYIHPSSSLFQHQPPVKTILYYELVMTSKSYMRRGIGQANDGN